MQGNPSTYVISLLAGVGLTSCLAVAEPLAPLERELEKTKQDIREVREEVADLKRLLKDPNEERDRIVMMQQKIVMKQSLVTLRKEKARLKEEIKRHQALQRASTSAPQGGSLPLPLSRCLFCMCTCYALCFGGWLQLTPVEQD